MAKKSQSHTTNKNRIPAAKTTQAPVIKENRPTAAETIRVPIPKRNRAIEFYRFFAAALILCYHCHWFAYREDTQFNGYYLFVEFFFILSGFLMMRSIRRSVTPEMRSHAANSAFTYTWMRLKAFYPHHLLSFILVLLIEIFLFRTKYTIELIETGWTELLLVNLFGYVRGGYINIVCWYLSGLLFSSLAIHYLVLKDEDGFVKIIAPFVFVLFYGSLFDKIGCLATTIVFTRYSPPLGFMRSFAAITAGVVSYRIYEWLADVRLPSERFLSTLTEAAILTASVLFMYNSNFTRFDFLFVPLFCVFVISVFRGRSALSEVLDNALSAWLGRQCFAFFLNNAVVIYLCMYFCPGMPVGRMAVICLPCCLVLSWITGCLTGSNRT